MNKWIFPVACSVIAIVVSIWTYDDLPGQIAVHFNANQQADNYLSKPLGAFLVPVLIFAIPLLMIITRRFERDESKRRRSEAVMPAMIAAVSLLLLALHGFIISYNLGYDLNPATAVAAAAGAFFILIGNLLPRMSRGSFRWPKLSADAERRFTRFQGRFMFALGITLLLLTLLPSSYISPALLTGVAVFIVVTAANIIRFK